MSYSPTPLYNCQAFSFSNFTEKYSKRTGNPILATAALKESKTERRSADEMVEREKSSLRAVTQCCVRC